jgi:hypothetical protein
LDELPREVPPGAMGLVLQPYWTPGPDHAAYLGSIIGFGDIHAGASLSRDQRRPGKVKEGAQLTERKNAVPIQRVCVRGGSQSDGIVQATADVSASRWSVRTRTKRRWSAPRSTPRLG